MWYRRLVPAVRAEWPTRRRAGGAALVGGGNRDELPGAVPDRVRCAASAGPQPAGRHAERPRGGPPLCRGHLGLDGRSATAPPPGSRHPLTLYSLHRATRAPKPPPQPDPTPRHPRPRPAPPAPLSALVARPCSRRRKARGAPGAGSGRWPRAGRPLADPSAPRRRCRGRAEHGHGPRLDVLAPPACCRADQRALAPRSVDHSCGPNAGPARIEGDPNASGRSWGGQLQLCARWPRESMIELRPGCGPCGDRSGRSGQGAGWRGGVGRSGSASAAQADRRARWRGVGRRPAGGRRAVDAGDDFDVVVVGAGPAGAAAALAARRAGAERAAAGQGRLPPGQAMR